MLFFIISAVYNALQHRHRARDDATGLAKGNAPIFAAAARATPRGDGTTPLQQSPSFLGWLGVATAGKSNDPPEDLFLGGMFYGAATVVHTHTRRQATSAHWLALWTWFVVGRGSMGSQCGRTKGMRFDTRVWMWVYG